MFDYYANEELYKFSEKWSPIYDDVNNVLIIDDFYENADDIYEHIECRPKPLWKYNPERNSKNSKDYLDCRIIDKNGHPGRIYYAEHERLLNLCRQYWWKGRYEWSNVYEFNCFKTINVDDKKIQHYPHIDSELQCADEVSVLNMLVYMDKEEDGGTAIYRGEWITNDEQMNLMYPVHDRFKLDHVIPAKFNRCAIFPGNRMHGAYIDDYSKYKENWRYTKVTFFHPKQ
tara:strand:+ start:1086 stop:1772 length:687 start_codon:yes stop_codon:yes gene_type:complete